MGKQGRKCDMKRRRMCLWSLGTRGEEKTKAVYIISRGERVGWMMMMMMMILWEVVGTRTGPDQRQKMTSSSSSSSSSYVGSSRYRF